MNIDDLSESKVAESIKQLVGIYYDAPEDCFSKKTRKREYIKIKHLACYMTKKHTTLSQKRIGQIYNLKNHSSIVCLIKKIDGEAQFDKQLKEEMKEINEIIQIKGLSKDGRLNENNHFHINLDNFISVRNNSEKAIIYVGYTEEEIKEKHTEEEIRVHTGTRKFILEKK
jgi:hypothetical protein